MELLTSGEIVSIINEIIAVVLTSKSFGVWFWNSMLKC